jgi:hypothetical protein
MSADKGFQKSNMPTPRVCNAQPPAHKMSKHEAVRRLAQLAEEDMDRKGLSEDKKNARVQRFVEHVDAVSAGRAK